VSDKDEIMVTTKMVLNLMKIKWLLDFVGRSKSWHLIKTAFGSGGTMTSVNSCKTCIQTSLCSQRHISNLMRGSSFQIITFIGLTATREGKAFPLTM
jgi:hypothetical protein